MNNSQGQSHGEMGFYLQNPVQHQPTPIVGWNPESKFEKPPPYNPYFNNENVISTQPSSIGFISANPPLETQIPVDCLPGLEYLSVIDQLLICQQVELLEMLTGYETQNKYQIRNTLGQPVFFAAEDSGCCARFCCGTIRPLNLVIWDNFEREILHFQRPLNCQSCFYPCCLQQMEVKSPVTGEVIGIIEQTWSLVRPKLSIKTPHGETILKIRGPLLICSCCCNDVVFNILTPHKDKEVIGTITKQWSGFCKEVFTDADNFAVTFPVDLDVNMKATLLAAVFLIDYMYFEDSSSHQATRNSAAAEVTCRLLKCFL